MKSHRRGLKVLRAYLARCWHNSRFPHRLYEDATQTAILDMIERLGTERFEVLIDRFGKRPVKDVLSADSKEFQAFTRSIWKASAQARRCKQFKSLGDDYTDSRESDCGLFDVTEAMRITLDAREADVIEASMRGLTPRDIAITMGVSPKTVSNLKSQAVGKLREVFA